MHKSMMYIVTLKLDSFVIHMTSLYYHKGLTKKPATLSNWKRTID